MRHVEKTANNNDMTQNNNGLFLFSLTQNKETIATFIYATFSYNCYQQTQNMS